MSDDFLASELRESATTDESMTRRAFLRFLGMTGASVLIGACEVIPQPFNADLSIANEDLASPYPVSAAASDINPNDLARFIQISTVLTGFDDLNPELARIYMQSISNTEHDATLEDLYSRAGVAIGTETPPTLDQLRQEGILGDATLNGLVTSIVNHWYTGTYPDGENTIVATYTNALAWRSLDFTKPRTICGSPGFWQTNPYQQP